MSIVRKSPSPSMALTLPAAFMPKSSVMTASVLLTSRFTCSMSSAHTGNIFSIFPRLVSNDMLFLRTRYTIPMSTPLPKKLPTTESIISASVLSIPSMLNMPSASNLPVRTILAMTITAMTMPVTMLTTSISASIIPPRKFAFQRRVRFFTGADTMRSPFCEFSICKLLYKRALPVQCPINPMPASPFS